jgi:hypothetical protein
LLYKDRLRVSGILGKGEGDLGDFEDFEDFEDFGERGKSWVPNRVKGVVLRSVCIRIRSDVSGV